MGVVDWDLRLYDIHCSPITATSFNHALPASNKIRHAEERNWTVNLNSFDELEFMLYLDDPMAAKIRRGNCVVKLFRTINDTKYDKHLDTDQPCFSGVVGYTIKNGAENTMRVKCYSPLWRLQSHFHILNHYLETNPDTDDFYTQSELMWKLIDLVNRAFGGDSFTGISEGDFLYGAGEPQPVPFFVGKGSNTWTHIFDNLMNRPASPDILPIYFHANGDRTQMFFDTRKARGTDRTEFLSFNYHTDPDVLTPNCDDMTEEEQIVPGEFGNYLWAIGDGGANSGRVAARKNSSSVDGSDGTGDIGVYMVLVDRSDVRLFGALPPIAEAEFKKRRHPIPAYTVLVSPDAGLYYDLEFTLGDVGYLNADRGALQLSNVKQRIYQAVMSMSANNVESTQIIVSSNFFSKVVP